MRVVIALLVVLYCSAVLGVSSQGFRPGKKHAAHAHRHTRLAVRDLEESIDEKKPSFDASVIEKMDKTVDAVMADISTLQHDVANFREMEEEVKKSLKIEASAPTQHTDEDHSASKENADEDNENAKLDEEEESPVTSKKEASKPESATAENGDDVEKDVTKGDEEAKDEAKDVADDLEEHVGDEFLELESVDDMNGALEDDEGAAPMLLMNKMRRNALVQHSAGLKKYDGEEGVKFGMAGDGSGRQFEITESGETLMHAPPDVPVDQVKPNDVKYRINPNDKTFRIVDTAPIDPAEVPMDASIPGTGGKQWSLKVGTNSTNPEEDSVCVCKRRGAPRGHDRIRCKRHPTPTPTPVVPVPEIPNIVQCTNGTWPKSDSVDSGTRDIICVYFPGRAPIPTPTPAPIPPEPEYPPECYDPRNEFVAEGVEKLPFDSMLLQQGYEKCECGGSD